jgi:hypothetical protein
MGLPYETIDSFDGLDGYGVLVIGAGSRDNRVIAASQDVNRWIRRGGRLLQLEQQVPGEVAGQPGLSIVKRRGGSIGNLLAPAHPAFDGIRHPENWDRWSGRLPEASVYGRDNGIFVALLTPLNETALAVGVQNTPRRDNKAVQMLASEVRIGRGSAFYSQAEAVRRYGVDSVATRYLHNVIRHVLIGNTAFAETMGGLQIENLAFREFGYIDLAGMAETVNGVPRPPALAEGMEDLGGLRFRFPAGKRMLALTGPTEVRLPLAERMHKMFPKWDEDKIMHNPNVLGLNPQRPRELFFLHRAAKAQTRQAIGEYVLTYVNGKTERLPIEVGRNIAVADDAVPELAVAVAGLFVTRWTVPDARSLVESLTIRVTRPGAELLVDGITASLVRDKVHD